MEGTATISDFASSRRASPALGAPAVLLVDDDTTLLEGFSHSLSLEGYRVHPASNGERALQIAAEAAPDVALIDVRMPGIEGIPLLRKLLDQHPGLPIILMTGYATIATAVEAIREGAYDFVEKPLRRETLIPLIQKAAELRRMRNELRRLRDEIHQIKLSPIVGQSPSIRLVLQKISSVAAAPNTTVLVHGESGTGKELVARAIHDSSARREKPFVAVNCAALTETLLEAELFGYEKGAFTGAAPGGKQGLFCAADGGTLFLDEVSELAPSLQAKLLRALQERTVRRVGGERDIPVNVRVIASTNRDLSAAVTSERFRQDLFFRLNVLSIQLPPLRERREDVALLSHFFLDGYNRELAKSLRGFSTEAMQTLMYHAWPGNVRELRNAIERAAILAEGPLIQSRDLLLQSLLREVPAPAGNPLPDSGGDQSIRAMEKALIEQVLRESRGNISRSAEILGINRTTLYNKIRSYSVSIS